MGMLDNIILSNNVLNNSEDYGFEKMHNFVIDETNKWTVPNSGSWNRVNFDDFTRTINNTPSDIEGWMNTTTGLLENFKIGDKFDFSMNLKIENTTNNNFIKIGYRVNKVGYPIVEELSMPIVRDMSSSHNIVLSAPIIITLQEVEDYGIEMYIAVDSELDLWDMSIIIDRTYKA